MRAAGAWVVVRRGLCSFTHKALLAQAAGAAGLLVVNGEGSGEVMRMPGDPDLVREGAVLIPAVMVAAGEGGRLAQVNVNEGRGAAVDARTGAGAEKAAAIPSTAGGRWEARAVVGGSACKLQQQQDKDKDRARFSSAATSPSQGPNGGNGGSGTETGSTSARGNSDPLHPASEQPGSTRVRAVHHLAAPGGMMYVLGPHSWAHVNLTALALAAVQEEEEEDAEGYGASRAVHVDAAGSSTAHAYAPSSWLAWESVEAHQLSDGRTEYLRGEVGASQLPAGAPLTSRCPGLVLRLSDPKDACSSINTDEASLPAAAGAITTAEGAEDALPEFALLVDRGGCSFQEKARNAALAGASIVIIVNDQAGLMPMQASTSTTSSGVINRGPHPPGDQRGQAGTAASQPSIVSPGVVMIPLGAGARLRQLALSFEASEQIPPSPAAAPYVSSSDPPPPPPPPPSHCRGVDSGPTLRVVFRGGDGVAEAWEGLAALARPDAWPADALSRKKLYMRAARAHHPDRAGGSQDRFEALVRLCWRAEDGAAGVNVGGG